MTVAVVGAGVFGSAAALELSLRGHRVTLFDADEVPAPRAASTDVSKAIRRVWYAEDKAGYVELGGALRGSVARLGAGDRAARAAPHRPPEHPPRPRARIPDVS